MGYTGEKHGHCKMVDGKVVRSPTYKSWTAMWDRCKPTHKSRSSYFDRGITVCEDWKDFEMFLEDMGERPEGTTLDRKDNDKGYYAGNCEWATKKRQAQNRRSTVLDFDLSEKIRSLKAEGISLSKIAKLLGINESTVKNVLYRGDWASTDKGE